MADATSRQELELLQGLVANSLEVSAAAEVSAGTDAELTAKATSVEGESDAIAELTTLPKNADLPAPTPSASTTNPSDSTGGGDALFENLIKEQQKQEPSSAPAAPKSGG